jgi:ABC-type nickel/cobalt efflux system permease component RcnA
MSRPIVAAFRVLVATLALFALATPAALAQTATSPTESPATAATAKPKSLLAGREDAARSSSWYSAAQAWLTRQQQSLNRTLTGSVRDLKSQGSAAAALLLVGLSFLYGILHAAGPGHGKAIISSYAVATTQTIRRSLGLSFLAALFQALSAIAIVLILALAFNATGLDIQAVSRRLEQVSFALIALFGAWLLVTSVWRYVFGRASAAGHSHGHGHGHDHHHHGHDHHHEHGAHCGHAHLPEPKDLAGPLSWRRAVLMAATIGIRPCSGAILLLVFALTQGMLWAGILGTFAMAFGTAITVGLLAALAVGTRQMAENASSARLGQTIEAVAAIGGACLVLGLGAVFFVASLGPAAPF